MMKRLTPKILPVLAGVMAPSLAFAIFDGGWNVDFNSDTVGQPPATAAYTDGAVNTAPKKISNVGVDTVLVTDALAGARANAPSFSRNVTAYAMSKGGNASSIRPRVQP
jgi:hypothetical protein